MSTDKIISRVEGAVGHLVFNNPEKRNAVSMEMWEAVGDAIDEFSANPDIRVLVVSGAGGKAFVSGADISKFASERASAEGVALSTRPSRRRTRGFRTFPGRSSP